MCKAKQKYDEDDEDNEDDYESIIRDTWLLYGVTSWGSKECGSRHHPGVYVKVPRFVGWIRRFMKGRTRMIIRPNNISAPWQFC